MLGYRAVIARIAHADKAHEVAGLQEVGANIGGVVQRVEFGRRGDDTLVRLQVAEVREVVDIVTESLGLLHDAIKLVRL